MFKKLWIPIIISVCLFLLQKPASAEIIFSEDFDGYTDFPVFDLLTGWKNEGIPTLSEGADEIWYGGRFEYFDSGTIDQELAIQKLAGGGDPDREKVAHFEDEAGLLFHLDTSNLTDVKLSFDWKTYHTNPLQDRLVVGYYIEDLSSNSSLLGFGSCTGEGESGCYKDFFTDNFDTGHPILDNAAAENWWATEWTQILSARSPLWQTETDIALPEGEESVWVAFWLDNGENDFGKIDNIIVTATVVPEPVSSILFVIGSTAFAVRRRFL